MRMIIKYIFSSVLLLTAFLSTKAITLEEAKSLYIKGKYSEALPAFKELYKTPKNAKNASINQWLGVCLYKTGSYEEAKKYLEYAASRSVAESNLYLSKIEFELYNFSDAQTYIDKYSETLSKLDKPLNDDVKEFIEKVRNAKSMLEHVERITVIDSIVVDKDDFFKQYKISPSIGTFTDSEVLPYNKPENTSFVFATESGEKLLWADNDTANISRIYETSHLIDGTWEPYRASDELLNNGGTIKYPFMMPDGSTLYYSCNGEGSIGGYDIFMSRKNLEDGTFYQPQNVGMPYNSMYDDYLLVIDENTGVGWWATDRNQIPEKLTIYIFIPNQVRENYSSEDENLRSYALVKCIRDTWQDGADYSQYFDNIESIENSSQTNERQFEFEIRKGVFYTNLNDVVTTEGKQYMEQYIDACNNYNRSEKLLKEKRTLFANADKSEKLQLKREILNIEKGLLKKQQEIKYLRNAVIKAEQRNR